MTKVRKICEDSFDAVLCQMNKNYKKFLEAMNQPVKELPWKTDIVDFGQLYGEAKASYGEAFEKAYEEKLKAEKLAKKGKK